MAQRINFGTLVNVVEPPDLIEVQLASYREFLQRDVAPTHRKPVGLQGVFKEVFPIESYDGQYVLDFVRYDIKEPKLGPLECLREGQSYTAPLYVTFRVKDLKSKETAEEELYIGDIPLMTESGTFIINGAERVIVSQLHRSPGICFESKDHPNGSVIYSFRVIPDRGSWLEVQFDTSDTLHVFLDSRRRRRKFLAVTFLRALIGLGEHGDGEQAGKGTDEELLRLYYPIERLNLSGHVETAHRVLLHDVVDPDNQLVLARAYDPLTPELVRQIRAAGYSSVDVVNVEWDEGVFLANVKRDAQNRNAEDALKDLYTKLRPGDPPTLSNARQLLKRLFFDPTRYNLTKVGRYKIHQKLGKHVGADDCVVLCREDIVEGIRYLINLRRGEGTIDDIDHLGSRRVRTVGELLESQCRLGLARMERMVRERMTILDPSVEKPTPQRLVNPKTLSTVIRDFFGRSQLSQFMDQTNPLSELAHKRRLSALGPGGLNRERAGFEVRDVHSSHYGRICPIETPEGPNIGLISSLSMYARVNEFGFIESPYRRVEKGRVTDQVDYLTADEEEKYVIAQANAPLDAQGRFVTPMVMVRKAGEFREVPREAVQYMDVSPRQVVSVAAALIPFLEHDDANRALMGSNMQRQAVPLLQSEAPYVATGNEEKIARDSRVLVLAKEPGVVAYVSASRIIVTPDGRLPDRRRLNAPGVQVYELRKFMRTNAGTCFNQKPRVRVGQKVRKGDVLADGPSTEDGELALGRNVLVAFMPWHGYNFEDAIVISERLVRDDVFTSIHIEEFECTARETKLGPEEITRDIPNVSEEALRNLTHSGVIRVGAEVKPGDILVGKVTPKTETELAPEERLLRAIFGEKAADVRDTSLRVPSGTYGIVMGVQMSSKNSTTKRAKLSSRERRQQAKQIQDEFREKRQALLEDLTEALSNILLGEKIPVDVVNAATGETIIPANRKITKTLLRKLAMAREHVELEEGPSQAKIRSILSEYNRKFSDLEAEEIAAQERLESGEELDTGIVKQVKVYVATKKKISVGDKMAGRHGNKGVIAKIVPEEDMPFLEDGTPVDIVLNPLGVPSRMNVGQLLETHLGWAARYLGYELGRMVRLGAEEQELRSLLEKLYGAAGRVEEVRSMSRERVLATAQTMAEGARFASPVFDGAPESQIRALLEEAHRRGAPVGPDGKAIVYDGETGEPFDQRVVVGVIYMMKLHHLATDKIHARAVGPYSLVTQQPLGGKAQYGGQRFGEMEVWAMEAYGAAYSLQELLTVKSDDIRGRAAMYEAIVKGDNVLQAGTPESFNVLVKELQSLALDIKVHRSTKE
jgi:DNA-directed RNA polymerase subunit beta